jgi:subtilisin family serine protease
VIVSLRDRADLGAIGGSTRAARLRSAILALQAKADVSQVGLRALLRVRTAQGKVARTTNFWVSNAISVTATADVIRELTIFPRVESVALDDVPVVPTAGTPEPNLSAVGGPAAWDLGSTGQGVVVATLDSGVDVSHPDLAGQWRGGTNSWFDPYGQHPGGPVDMTGHGTGTMGVIVGGDAGGTSIGMAPGARWIAARIFNDSGQSTATAIHAAFQWLLDPDGNPNTADAPNVVNNSWSYGYGSTCNLAFQPDVQALRAAGIVPVFAAGNFGPGASTSVSPANYPESLAVGAVNGSGLIYSGSSRGPSACGETSTIYPEIVAPGVGITTTDRYGMYQVASGTSLAAPHVAGALALLLSAHPNLTAAQQESALKLGAHDLGVAGPDGTFGSGLLDFSAANALASAPDFTLGAAPSSLTVTVGDSAVSTLTVGPSSGFSGDVSLSVSGVPVAASAVLAPAVVAGGAGASQLTVSTQASIAPGTYPLTITGTSGALSHAVGLSLVVTAPPDFGLSFAPSSVTVAAGGGASFTVSASALNGFTGDVALSLAGLTSSQATWSFTPTSVAAGSGTSQLAITTAGTLAPGSYPLTITGVAGAMTHAAQGVLVVSQPPDFTLGVTPGSVTVKRGGQASAVVSVGSVSGFTSTVKLTVSGLPSGVTASFSKTSVVPGQQSTLTLKATSRARTGTATITITGIGGGKTHTTPVTATVT